jgi:Dna[CI] antecedent, DciA
VVALFVRLLQIDVEIATILSALAKWFCGHFENRETKPRMYIRGYGWQVVQGTGMPIRSDHDLARLQNAKHRDTTVGQPLGPAMISFFKQSVEKRQGKLAKIAECWAALVPEALNDHCALEGFTRGTLSVIVDSSSHLYELKQLLLAGLQDQLLLACRSSGLRKISLKPGRWYDAGVDDRRPRF